VDAVPHASWFCIPPTDGTLSSKACDSSEKRKSITGSSGRPSEMYTAVSSDLERLSCVPSVHTKSDKLSLEAQQVYAELIEISNKLKVFYDSSSTICTTQH